MRQFQIGKLSNLPSFEIEAYSITSQWMTNVLIVMKVFDLTDDEALVYRS